MGNEEVMVEGGARPYGGVLGLSGIGLREALVQVVRGANVDLVWASSTANDVRNALGPPSPSRQEARLFSNGACIDGFENQSNVLFGGHSPSHFVLPRTSSP